MELPKEKHTLPELYVTSNEAFEMWKSSPEKIKILDVRTTEEYLFVGHADMVWNVPAFLQIYQWDAEKQKFPMILNPGFLEEIKKIFGPDDIILVTCRSGGRSAMAVNFLFQAGFKNVYNITDGFEGDVVNDPESFFHGKHFRNGWKNSGLPWTYNPNPEKMRIPTFKTTNQ